VLLGLIAIALAVASGSLAGQVSALRSNLSLASTRATRDKADLEHQIGQLSNSLSQLSSSLSGIASRLSGVETTLKSQPNPAAITKTVEASLFVIETPVALGSGFAVSSSNGHTRILTNFHVVAMSEGSTSYFKSVNVVQHNETFPGTVVKIDQVGDLAVIDVAAVFPQLPLDKNVPAAGETVYAFGAPAPLGQQLEDTVTQGVVSGLRLIEGLDRLQFSAQINPGNSGGPVVDSAGKVVGIAELSITSAQGLFFAVPMGRACQTVVAC
jgi:S1-C subfamily serine protease